MTSEQKSNQKKQVVYREFGSVDNTAAFERAKPDLPPQHQQQSLKVQATRSGRKGKTVTVISGFQASEETLNTLLKQLKTQCGSGGTVKEQTLELQGEHKDKIVQVLTIQGYKVKISGG